MGAIRARAAAGLAEAGLPASRMVGIRRTRGMVPDRDEAIRARNFARLMARGTRPSGRTMSCRQEEWLPIECRITDGDVLTRRRVRDLRSFGGW